jgi:hypothetical protein
MPQPRKYRSDAERQAACRRRRRAALQALQATKGLPALPSIATIPGWQRWREVLDQVENALNNVLDQMQSYYDDRSDDWLESYKAEEFIERMKVVQKLADRAADCRMDIG